MREARAPRSSGRVSGSLPEAQRPSHGQVCPMHGGRINRHSLTWHLVGWILGRLTKGLPRIAGCYG